MSFLSTLQEFGGKWEETERESLDAKEIKAIKEIKVVERYAKDTGEAFLCMCFFMNNGKTRSAYLSKMSDLEEGDVVDPKSVEFITLERDGETTVKADGAILSKPKKRGKKQDEEDEEED